MDPILISTLALILGALILAAIAAGPGLVRRCKRRREDRRHG